MAEKKIQKKHWKSDFTVRLTAPDWVSLESVPWICEVWTASESRALRFTNDDAHFVDGKAHLHLKDHHLAPGTVRVRLKRRKPDECFPDGRKEIVEWDTEIVLVTTLRPDEADVGVVDLQIVSELEAMCQSAAQVALDAAARADAIADDINAAVESGFKRLHVAMSEEDWENMSDEDKNKDVIYMTYDDDTD